MLDKVVRDLFRRGDQPQRPRFGALRASAKPRRPSFALELLEPRLLLSADLNGGVLTGNLTAQDDTVVVSLNHTATPDGVAKDLEDVFGYFPVLRERADQRAGSLSGGEQQMLAISRALMARPRLMLLDEPSLGLSPKLVKDIFEIVVRINRERGVTILLVEQNANMALQTADFGYVLEVGRIVMADTCERLMQKEDIKEFYLGIKEQGARGKRRWKKRKTWR